MQDSQDPSAGLPPAGSPASQFRTLVDSTIDAIHPMAEMETWAHDHSIFTQLMHPDAHGRETDAFDDHLDEAAGFTLLADSLDSFRRGLDQIQFPAEVQKRVAELRDRTDALAAIARSEKSTDGFVPVDGSRSDRRHFLHAVNAWQGSVASVADHLGL